MKNRIAFDLANAFFVSDEPHGDLADSAQGFEEAYRTHALLAVLASPRHRRRRNRKKGLCEQCGEVIPKERMAVMPGARRCVACQHVVEQKQGIRRRTARHYL